MSEKTSKPVPSPALSREELIIVNNALNEICHALNFGDDEFQTRIGYPRSTAEKLLKKIAKALET